MSALTWQPARPSARPADRLPLSTRLRHVNETIRWAPAPYFEGSVRQRLHYVGYLVGSVLGWTLGSLLVLAVLGRALSLV